MSERIPGVERGRLTRNEDLRGSFIEFWRASASEATYVQANRSTSAPGVLRGLHLHRRQADRWMVVSGRALVALVDVRPLIGALSGMTAAPIVETLEMGPDDRVDLPAGVAHGFLALEPLELIYLVTAEYDGTDELGFAWNDPDAAVAWPDLGAGRPILSERDQTNPSLRELVVRLRT